MIFGLTGASRTGKTTLAMALAQKTAIHYRDMSFGLLANIAGYKNPVAEMTITQRLQMQVDVLEAYKTISQTFKRPFITDRTPIDMIGYMYGEITMNDNSGELSERIQQLISDCIGLTINTFDTILMLRPFGTYEVQEGKPPPNAAYQWMTQYIMEGAMNDVADLVHYFRVLSVDPAERLMCGAQVISARLEDIQKEKAEYVLH